ncbi:MAG: hypothetical protein JNL50_12205 [Phycisphaerae bacterium]|nr:hypothetical protein [Phycisphaerae bacterium]
MGHAGNNGGVRRAVAVAAAWLSMFAMPLTAAAQDEKPAEFVPGPLVDYGQKLYDLTIRDQDPTAPNGYDAMMRISAILDELNRDFAERYGGPDKKPEDWPESVGYPIDFDALTRPDTPEESKRITREYMARIEASGIPAELRGLRDCRLFVRPKANGALIDVIRDEVGRGRKLVRYLKAHSADAAARGDWDAIVQHVADVRAIASALGREPVLISHFVAIAMDTLAVQVIRDSVVMSEPDQKALIELGDRVGVELPYLSIARAIDGEHLWYLDISQCVHDANGRFASAELERLAETKGQLPFPQAALALMPDRAASDAMAAQVYARLGEVAQLPRRNRPRTPDGRIELGILRPQTFVVVGAALANVDNVCSAPDRHSVQLNAALLIIALERCRLARGRYPEKLDELVPEFLPGVPEDPYFEKGFVYERGDDPAAKGTYTLYSVGDDGEDNGGLRAEHEHDALVPAGKGTDFVFMPPASK